MCHSSSNKFRTLSKCNKVCLSTSFRLNNSNALLYFETSQTNRSNKSENKRTCHTLLWTPKIQNTGSALLRPLPLRKSANRPIRPTPAILAKPTAKRLPLKLKCPLALVRLSSKLPTNTNRKFKVGPSIKLICMNRQQQVAKSRQPGPN